MKRVCVEQGIYLRINDNGKVSNNCFEIVKVRTIWQFKEAIQLFKKLHSLFPTVYMYKGSNGYRVEYKSYTDNLNDAQKVKAEVEAVLEVWEDDK